MHAPSETKHDASRGARLILRGSVQLRAEIIHLNQAELHKGNEFDIEPGADGGGKGGIGAECERAGDRRNGGTDIPWTLRFYGRTEQGVHERRDSCGQRNLRPHEKGMFTGACAVRRAVGSVEIRNRAEKWQQFILPGERPAIEICL